MTVLNKDKILETIKDFIAQGKFDKAIREYEKLLEVDPKDMRIKLRLAELYAKNRQIPNAIKAYREVAEAYSQEGFYLKAVTVYKSILRLNPSLLDINQSLALLYEKMGLNQDAIHQHEIVAAAFEQKAQYDEALKIRQKLVELSPQDAHHRVRLAESFQRSNQKEEAIEQYEILAKQYKEQNKEPSRLIELYERILPHRSNNHEMFADLVKIYYDKKDYKAALRWLEIGKHVLEDPQLLRMQAEMYATLNQLETSRGKYEVLADLYKDQGDMEQALSAYEEIMVLLPEEMEDIRPLIEEIDPKGFDAVVKRANEKRSAKIETARQEEEAKEKAREQEKEDEREKKKGPSKQPTVKGAKKAFAPTAAPAQTAQAEQAAPKKSAAAINIAALLKTANSALALVKAYQLAGLDSEATQELVQARTALEKVIAADAANVEAQAMMQTLQGLEK